MGGVGAGLLLLLVLLLRAPSALHGTTGSFLPRSLLFAARVLAFRWHCAALLGGLPHRGGALALGARGLRALWCCLSAQILSFLGALVWCAVPVTGLGCLESGCDAGVFPGFGIFGAGCGIQLLGARFFGGNVLDCSVVS